MIKALESELLEGFCLQSELCIQYAEFFMMNPFCCIEDSITINDLNYNQS